jgi:regulator of sigma E protease
MISILLTAIGVLLLFGVTIFIHELGHYLVARWFGMKVETFAIGFGPAIVRWKKDGILYKIGIIPFGGYVALPQMEPVPEGQVGEDGKPLEKWPDVPPSHKIPVALAGVIGNMILAFILAWIIYIVGKPSSPHERDTVIGYVQEASSAYEQGMRAGDRILTINGERVANWNDINMNVTLSKDVTLLVERPEEDNTFEVELETQKTDLGVRLLPGVGWFGYVDVGSVTPGSPAERAGIQSGDRLVAFNGIKLNSQGQMIDLVEQSRDQEATVDVKRGEELLTLNVTPAYDPSLDRVLIGIRFMPSKWVVDFDQKVHPRPMQMIGEFSTMIFRVLQALVTPSSSGMAASALSGPVVIFKVLWDMVENSFVMALWFTCLLNVNLAVLNLLPLPVLDGGHIVFSLYEMITRRRVNVRFKMALMSVCWVFLIAVMIFISVRDVIRLGWVPKRQAAIEQPVEDKEADDAQETQPASRD